MSEDTIPQRTKAQKSHSLVKNYKKVIFQRIRPRRSGEEILVFRQFIIG